MSLVRLVATALVSLCMPLVVLCIYRLRLHPLSGIPGPRLAAISNVWHAYHVRNGRMFRLGTTLHQKYGPAVRVGPNEVWFNSREAFDVIYGPTNGFRKSDFYLATAQPKPWLDSRYRLCFHDTLDLLSERDMKRYRLQRRLIGPLYQPRNLDEQYAPVIDRVMDHVVAQLRSLDGTTVDLKEWMHIIAVECLSAVTITSSPGLLRDKTDHGAGDHGYAAWRRKSVFGLFPLAVKAEILSKAAGRAFANIWGVTYQTPRGFKPFFPYIFKKISRRVGASVRANLPRDTQQHPDLLSALTALHLRRPESFKEPYLRRMAMTNLGAGHETTTSALVSAMAVISTDDAVQERIREGTATVANAATAADPFTQAVIREAQRLYPAIGMSLPRVVPAAHGHGGGGLRLHGHRLPPGTVVGCCPAALHRNDEVFGPGADGFLPERWGHGAAAGAAAAAAAMERAGLVWGGGDRTCPGRHLAWLILCRAVPRLVGAFRVEAVEVPPEEEIRYYFMAMLTGVKVRFVPR